MNLPIEIVELVISQFFLISESSSSSFIDALNIVSLISSFYLERTRSIKYKNLRIDNEMVSFYVLGPSFTGIYTIWPPRELFIKTSSSARFFAEYVKHLILNRCRNSLFIQTMVNEHFNLESIAIICSDRDLLDLLSNLKLERIPRLDRLKFSSVDLSNSQFNQCTALVSRLNPAIKFELSCSVSGVTQAIQHPIFALEAKLFNGTSSLSCFDSCLETLRKLDLDIEENIEENGLNCDSFIASAINLQDLTITRLRFARASLIATLREARKLKHIRKVKFIKYRSLKINIFFKNQIQSSIDIELNSLRIYLYGDDGFGALIRDLLTDTGTAKRDALEEMFGQVVDVDIRWFVEGAYIKKEAYAETLVNFY